MSDLPEGWIRVALEEVAEINPRRSLRLDDKTPVSFVPMAAVDEISGAIVAAVVRPFQAVSRGFTQFQDGDVLVAKITPSMENGKAAIARDLRNGIGFGSTEFHVIRSNGAVIPDFVWHFIRQQSFRNNAKEVMTGAVGQLRVPAQYLRRHQIPIAPILEQGRMVFAIDKLLERIALARSELIQVDSLSVRLRERILAIATDGRLTADWRHRASKPEPESVELGEVCEDISYGSSAKSARTGEMPVLRMGNIQEGKLVWDDLVYSSDEREIRQYSLRPGDVLFNRTNSPELVGKTAMYAGERPAIFAGYLIRVRCSDRLDPRFLTYCLNSPMGRAFSWSVKSDGVSQSNINASKLRAFRFLLPDIAEQQEIVRRVDMALKIVRKALDQVELARNRLARLNEQILERAFRGELVPQDPNEESASALLERIRAKREALTILQPPVSDAPPPIRAPRRKAAMTKNRNDDDVWHKPYLAEILKFQNLVDTIDLSGVGNEFGSHDYLPSSRALASALFKKSELAVVDFYKQLAWEVDHGYIIEADGTLRAA